MKEVRITLNLEDIQKPLSVSKPSYRLYIDKSKLGSNEHERKNYNLFAIARNNSYVKKFVTNLANDGYFLVKHDNGISVFEKYISAKKFAHNFITNTTIKVHNDLFYTLDDPKITTINPRLLVVFSSVADFSLNASISRRNFFTNFKSIGKYIPSNTYILRISDIGGIVGSFYLNNNFNTKVERNIQDLILFIMKKHSIIKNDVVFYGASKGGTGALYHGIFGGYKSVAVDPIVSDKYHEENYNDPHFTNGTFPANKQEKFSSLIKSSKIPRNTNIIYSKNSPLYSYINSIVRNNDIKQKINYINSTHPKIKDHPDVGPNTIHILTLIINTLFYELGSISTKDIDL